jgi:hypothetical protein
MLALGISCRTEGCEAIRKTVIPGKPSSMENRAPWKTVLHGMMFSILKFSMTMDLSPLTCHNLL